jgi:hypothetical protein
MNANKYQYLKQVLISDNVELSFRFAMLSKIVFAQYSVLL